MSLSSRWKSPENESQTGNNFAALNYLVTPAIVNRPASRLFRDVVTKQHILVTEVEFAVGDDRVARVVNKLK